MKFISRILYINEKFREKYCIREVKSVPISLSLFFFFTLHVSLSFSLSPSLPFSLPISLSLLPYLASIPSPKPPIPLHGVQCTRQQIHCPSCLFKSFVIGFFPSYGPMQHYHENPSFHMNLPRAQKICTQKMKTLLDRQAGQNVAHASLPFRLYHRHPSNHRNDKRIHLVCIPLFCWQYYIHSNANRNIFCHQSTFM